MTLATGRSSTSVAGGALIGTSPAAQLTLRAHLDEHGSLPASTPRDVLRHATEAGLTGHGGAGFPLWRKLEAVTRSRGRAVVVANGAEGEPASRKDRWLLTHRPHLVLDGLQLVARAVGARDALLYVSEAISCPPLLGVLAERRKAKTDRRPVVLLIAPNAFISGEESAVVSYLSGGAAVPRFKLPPVFERGVRGRPTLVSNVETLALLALIMRRGPEWFRSLGTPAEPGTMLCTVGGAVQQPGIVEAAHGTPMLDVLELAGGPSTRLQALLIGGYHGGWLSAHEAASTRLSRAALAPLGASPGAGVVIALGDGSCGLAETSRVLSYLARESAGQCGPCLNGLPRIAEQSHALAFHGTDRAVAELQRLAGLVAGRGACHHPDGSVRFVRSALRVFASEIALHQQGRCSRTTDDIVLPTPLHSAVGTRRAGA